MESISGFWAGAQDGYRHVDLVGLAEAVGGWANVASVGQAELVQFGATRAQAAAWLATSERQTRGQALTLADAGYPPALRKMEKPPPVLFFEGDPVAFEGLGLAVVGTRKCTAYGRNVARHLGVASAAAGLTVVSGMARGVDGAAHEGALSAKGRTIAVFGHGLAHTSPASHRRLRQDIVAGGGVVLSTWPDEVPPRPHTFPKRNAWISGLSEAVVVVEAGARSGAAITARAALKQGRDVFAVPGPLGAPASVGCLSLLSEGAGVVVDVEEFVAALAEMAVPRRADWLSEIYAGARVDEVARRHGRSTVELLTELSRLELEGRVVRLPGQRYAPSGRLL